MQADILVIGIGNPLRGDDNIGPQVICTLQDTLPALLKQHVVLETAHQIDISHIASIKDYQYVIIVDVDAALKDSATEVRKIKPEHSVPGFTSHIGSIPHLLYYTEKIFGSSPHCYLVAIAGHNFAFRTSLDAAKDINVTRGAATVLKLINQLLPNS